MKTIFFALNRKTNTACLLHGFSHWELVQSAFAIGILMPNGETANGIGRCNSLREFITKANHGGTTICFEPDAPFTLEIEVNGAKSEVTPSIWRTWTGKRFINGIRALGSRYVFLTNETAPILVESEVA